MCINIHTSVKGQFLTNCMILASEDVVICPNVLLFSVRFGFPLLTLFLAGEIACMK
jgi:hypothetical protein